MTRKPRPFSLCSTGRSKTIVIRCRPESGCCAVSERNCPPHHPTHRPRGGRRPKSETPDAHRGRVADDTGEIRAGPPMTLGNTAAAQVRLIVWCKGCGHQVEPDPAEMAARYGAETSVPDWRENQTRFVTSSSHYDGSP